MTINIKDLSEKMSNLDEDTSQAILIFNKIVKLLYENGEGILWEGAKSTEAPVVLVALGLLYSNFAREVGYSPDAAGLIIDMLLKTSMKDKDVDDKAKPSLKS